MLNKKLLLESLIAVMNEKRQSVARDILEGRLAEAEQGIERLKVMERYVARDKKELGIE